MKKKIIIILFIVFLLSTMYYGNNILILFENKSPSKSIGTTNNGRLINGKRLPTRGENYKSYSYIGSLLGRNTVNSKVKKVVLESYRIINDKYPDMKYIYGETGWPSGGDFWPHRTHENGLSVDFMVPIVSNNEVRELPVSVFNKFGYEIEFDDKGCKKDYKIDFESMGIHLFYLYKTTLGEPDIDIKRVIFDPKLQPYLFKTKYGKELKEKLEFSRRRSWVRHDEHYHVDFKIQ